MADLGSPLTPEEPTATAWPETDPRYLRYCDWPGCGRAYNVLTGPTAEVDGLPWVMFRSPGMLLCPGHEARGHRPGKFEWAPGMTTIAMSCECGARGEDLTPTNGYACITWWQQHVLDVDAASDQAPDLQRATGSPSELAPSPLRQGPVNADDAALAAAELKGWKAAMAAINAASSHALERYEHQGGERFDGLTAAHRWITSITYFAVAYPERAKVAVFACYPETIPGAGLLATTPPTPEQVAEAFPAGEYLRDELRARGWTQGKFAEVLGRSAQFVSEVICGKKEITRESAAQIGAALGTSAKFWLNLQDSYLLQRQQQDPGSQKRLDGVKARADRMASPPCDKCFRCLAPTWGEWESRPVVCETCGNKRCPHASDHVHACTGSNEYGQPGSDYAPLREDQ
jgi:addiction module HigA family antidote